MNTFASITAVGVRRDSVIGVYLGTSNPLPVIGMSNSGSISGNPIGACVTMSESTISVLTCYGSNEPNTIVHAEAEIGMSFGINIIF